MSSGAPVLIENVVGLTRILQQLQFASGGGVTPSDLDALLPRDGSRPMTGFLNLAPIDSGTSPFPTGKAIFYDTSTSTYRVNVGDYASLLTEFGGFITNNAAFNFIGTSSDTTQVNWQGISFGGTESAGVFLKQLTDAQFAASSPLALGCLAVSTTGNRPIFYDGTSAKYVLLQGDAGTGSVTSVSVTTANGISGTVATATTTPAITLTLGAITPTSVNGNTITAGTGTLTLASYTLTVAGTASVSGTNTGDQTNIAGNAATATALQTARNINGVSFNGTADITVTAAAGTLTGTTLNSTVVTSSLTSFGKATTAPMIQLGTIASIYG